MLLWSVLATADPDAGKADEVAVIGTTQARIRFEPVGLHAKSYGNPTVRQHNASSYLAPKTSAPANRAEVGRGGRGRGRVRGRGRGASSATGTREGSAGSSSAVLDGQNSNQNEAHNERDDSDMQGDENMQGASMPGVEEF